MISQKNLGLKIKEWRDEKDISQDDFAKAIGIPRVSVSELERGNRGIGAQELAKIARYFNVSVDYLLSPHEGKQIAGQDAKTNNFKLKEDKLRNLILYILEKCGGKPNMGETVLYKLLYFIDFDSFEIFGQPLTGLNYVNMQYGPIPEQKAYAGVIKKMIEQGQLKIFSQEYYGLAQKRYVALIEHDKNAFSMEEIKKIDAVINRLSDMSAHMIENYVHEDAPWKLTKEKEIIPYILAYSRTAPYAQSDQWVDWENAAGEDTLKHLGPISKEEHDYYSNL